jgi:two-component system cell cycle sensor histidine kinase/response regulator CckA
VGLGLSTVYGIVQLNGGTVELMSDHLTGTTVKVYLPRSEACPEREDESALDEDARPMRGGRILLVEDEVSVRQIVQRMREADGHEVITADGGKGALAAARDRVDELDLVITDVVMPGISGPEVIRSLREIRRGSEGAVHLGVCGRFGRVVH